LHKGLQDEGNEENKILKHRKKASLDDERVVLYLGRSGAKKKGVSGPVQMEEKGDSFKAVGND